MAAWDHRVGELDSNTRPWAAKREWMDWFPAIWRGLVRWVSLGGAAAEKRDCVRAGRERVRAVRAARRAGERARAREQRERLRTAAAEVCARVRWAKGVLKRARAEGGVWGGVAGVIEPVVWPVPVPPSPGEAERAERESELAAVALREARAQRKRQRQVEDAEERAVHLGAHGGPGASERGRLLAKRAKWSAKRGRGLGSGWGFVGVKRARGGGSSDTRLVEAGGAFEGRPTPEVLRRVRMEEMRRNVAGSKYTFKCSSARARRLLKLLREQQLGRTRARDRGRIRLALF